MRINKENLQVVKARKKERTKKICIAALVLSIILLLLPPALRIFVEPPPPPEKTIVSVLSCNRGSDSLSSTFLNGDPQYITYIVNGDQTVEVADLDKLADENDSSSSTAVGGQSMDTNNENITDQNTTESSSSTTEQSTTEPNNSTTEQSEIENETELLSGINTDSKLIGVLREYSTLDYSEEEKTTTISTEMSKMKTSEYYTNYFSSLDIQKNLYTKLVFICTSSDTVIGEKIHNQ